MRADLSRCRRQDPTNSAARLHEIHEKLRLGFWPRAAEAWLLASQLFVKDKAWIKEAVWDPALPQHELGKNPWCVWRYVRRASATWDDRLRIEWTPRRGIRFNTWNSGRFAEPEYTGARVYSDWDPWGRHNGIDQTETLALWSFEELFANRSGGGSEAS